MADDDLHDEISRLEARIDELAATIEGCRKITMMSKIAMMAGAAWMLATGLGAIRFDATAMIAAMTAVIGGIVFFGSNTSTSNEASADMKQAEKLRAELIGKLELRVVDDGVAVHSSQSDALH
jgi:hypothetical protein